MMSGIDEKMLSKPYPVKVCHFPGASANDMHHYLRPLLQKSPDTVILQIGTNNCVNESSACSSKVCLLFFIGPKIASTEIVSFIGPKIWDTLTNSCKDTTSLKSFKVNLNNTLRDCAKKPVKKSVLWQEFHL